MRIRSPLCEDINHHNSARAGGSSEESIECRSGELLFRQANFELPDWIRTRTNSAVITHCTFQIVLLRSAI